MMAENPSQPGEYDVVLGSQAPSPVDRAVLGGLEGVQQRLARESVEERIDALLDAFQYGQEGLELVVQALESKSEEVQEAAYLLLQHSTEPKIRLVLEVYNPYLFFKCLCTIQAYPDRGYRVCSVAVSSDRQTLVSCTYDGMIKVWNLHTQQIISTFKIEKIFQWDDIRRFTVAINSDEQILWVAAFQDYAEVWDIKIGQKIFTTALALGSTRIWSVTISIDGQTFASPGDERNCFYLWDLQTGKLISRLEEMVDCLRIGNRNGKSFQCKCGWKCDSDHNASLVISLLGASVNCPEGPWLSCLLDKTAGGLLKARAIASA